MKSVNFRPRFSKLDDDFFVIRISGDDHCSFPNLRFPSIFTIFDQFTNGEKYFTISHQTQSKQHFFLLKF